MQLPSGAHAILTAIYRGTALYGDTALLGDPCCNLSLNTGVRSERGWGHNLREIVTRRKKDWSPLMISCSYFSCRLKAQRSAAGIRRPLHSLRKGKHNKLRESGQRSTIDCSRCKLGALINAESPAAMLQESSPDATCMGTPCAPGILLFKYARCVCISELLRQQSFCR